MKVAVMQPYVFPYLGYFQLVAAADRFVFLDDVHFIKRGWVHRNRILVNGAPHTFTVPLTDASQNRRINETAIHKNAFQPGKLLRTIELCYRKAPHFAAIFEMARAVFDGGHTSISEMAKHSVLAVTEYLGCTAQVIDSSAVYANRELKGQERIVDISRREHASIYLNPIGGTEIYEPAGFGNAGISLRFLKSRPVEYPQFGGPFVPSLSMLDVLMFNAPPQAAALLKEFDLITPAEALVS